MSEILTKRTRTHSARKVFPLGLIVSLSSEFRITGFVHDTHAASAQLFEDFVVGYSGTWIHAKGVSLGVVAAMPHEAGPPRARLLKDLTVRYRGAYHNWSVVRGPVAANPDGVGTSRVPRPGVYRPVVGRQESEACGRGFRQKGRMQLPEDSMLGFPKVFEDGLTFETHSCEQTIDGRASL